MLYPLLIHDAIRTVVNLKPQAHVPLCLILVSKAGDKVIFTSWFIFRIILHEHKREARQGCRPMQRRCYSSGFHVFKKGFERPATLFQLRAAVAFWGSVWSASLVSCPNTEPQEETVFTVPQSEPCEVSRPPRHMFGISASLRIEHSRYMLEEPNPYRPKQKHACF